MAKTRPRRLGWPFGKRANRRVRLTGGVLPSPLRLAGGMKRLLWPLVGVVIAVAVAGASWGIHRFLTRSPHFAVRALRFSPTQHVSAESLAARAGEVIGQNLFRINLDELARDVLEEPWIASAHARRELPSTLVVDVVEREAQLSVALGPVYLADARGNLFKRATPDEAAAMPVITGVDRDLYLADPDGAREQIRQVAAALAAWRKAPLRPLVGEAHFDRLSGVTLFTVEGRVAVRLGAPGADLDARLGRFDAVWSALLATSERPRVIYLDNRARPDRVTVKLAAPPPALPSKKAKPKTELVPEDGDDSEKRDT